MAGRGVLLVGEEGILFKGDVINELKIVEQVEGAVVAAAAEMRSRDKTREAEHDITKRMKDRE